MVAEPWLLRMGNQVSSNLKNSLFLHHHHTSTNNSNNDNDDTSSSPSRSSCSKKKEPSSSSSSCNKNGKQKQKEKQKQKQKGKGKGKGGGEREIIGILSFEVANVMSKLVHLHKSVSEEEISKLKGEIIKSEGVAKLVSSDQSYLLGLAFAERIDDLFSIAQVVSRLGIKCTDDPALLGFEHVFADLTAGKLHLPLPHLGDIHSMIRKMDRFVASTCNLYAQLEVLNDLERASHKFHLNLNHNHDSRRAFHQKLSWQRQDVSHLKDVSLWNHTYDKVVDLLARTVCILYATISAAFPPPPDSLPLSSSSSSTFNAAGSLLKPVNDKRPPSPFTLQKGELDDLDFFHQRPDLLYPCAPSPARLFMECLTISSTSASKVEDDQHTHANANHLSCCTAQHISKTHPKEEHPTPPHCLLYRSPVGFHHHNGDGDRGQLQASVNASRPKTRLAAHATPSTVGGSALALHYANVIIVIEKLLHYPHLVGEEARDDLYQMLPSSLRKSLRISLKSHFKNFAIFDGALAHDWKETMHRILKWLAPLAHNMIRWQSERNFEQQQIVTRTNTLLLQTLYFADREKTESAICDLLVGLNYICRYEHQQNALLDCASSFDFGDWMEWQLQCQALCFD